MWIARIQGESGRFLIDILTLALGHGLLAIAAWRVLWREDCDSDSAGPAASGTARGRPAKAKTAARDTPGDA